MSRPRMPIQPIAKDERGTYRFVKNRIVEMLLEEGPFDMNRIAVQMIERGWTENEYFQFAQLIGYNADGGFGAHRRPRTRERRAAFADGGRR